MTHRVSVSFLPQLPQARLSAAAEPDATTDKPTRILGTAFAIGTPSGPSADGARYQFSSLPYNADELLDVVNEHDSWVDPIGRLASPFKLGDDQQLVEAEARIFDTTAGRDALVLASEGVKGGWSIAAQFADYEEDAEGVRHVQDPWTAIHLGLVRDPAFAESRGLTLAASAAPTKEEGAPVPKEALPGQVVELPTVEELAQKVNEFNKAQEKAPVHPLAKFPTHAAFTRAFQEADPEERQKLAAAFALPTTTTADLPGFMLPAWRRDLVTYLDSRRPAIAAFGGSTALPAEGMKVEWPTFDGDLDALIAEQLAELAELKGVKLVFGEDSETIRTAGAASEISFQAILRSSPSYMAQWQTIMEAAWARYTEAVFELSIQAKATRLDPATDPLPAIAPGAKPTAFKSLLFEASAAVEDATGAPANVVLASKDVWLELGGADLPAPGQGGENGQGTADAKSLRVEVNNLTIERAPFLDAGSLIVSNDKAAKFSESGSMLATADDVAKLGRDVAIWGMYVPSEVYYPAGVLRYARA